MQFPFAPNPNAQPQAAAPAPAPYPPPAAPAPFPPQGYPPAAPAPFPQGYPPPAAPAPAPFPPQGYPPAAQPYGNPNQPAVNSPEAVARMYQGADAAKPKYDRQYITGEQGNLTPGEYLLEFVALTPINVPPNPNSKFSGDATIFDFVVVESSHASHPVGASRALFVKQDTYAFQTLRNWFFAICGLGEQTHEREIAAFLARSPSALADALIQAASERETHAGLKGRRVKAHVAVKRSRASIEAPHGREFARATFHPA